MTTFPSRYAMGVRKTLVRGLDLGRIQVRLDLTVDGVESTAPIACDPPIAWVAVLNLSRRYAGDLVDTPFRVEATLSRGGVPFEVRLPYEAIFCVFSAPEKAPIEDWVLLGKRSDDGSWEDG